MPADSGARPPVRMAHLGVGAFHRAHQEWYTQRAGRLTGDWWGTAGFTGRSPAAARLLAPQLGRYSLIERGPERDAADVMTTLVSVTDGGDAPAWAQTLANPDVAVVTVTVTEAGYAPAGAAAERLAAGLAARRAVGGGPVAVVACDNLIRNGAVLEAAVLSRCSPELREWVREEVSFVSTMVDRITPATTARDVVVARRLTGFDDAAPVVTEPFTAWVLAGDFPAGRPAWEVAGARFVADVAPYEERKLWLLNAGHSFLAYAGALRGHTTVAEAFADPELRASLESLWAENGAELDLPRDEVDESLTALRERFANARIRHGLDQIARDGSHKLPARIGAPVRRRRARGLGPGEAQRATLLAWTTYLERIGPTDPESAALVRRLRGLGDDDRVDVVVAALLTPQHTEGAPA